MKACVLFVSLLMESMKGISSTFSGNLLYANSPQYTDSHTADSIFAFRRVPQTYGYNSRAYLESRPNQHIVYLRNILPVYKTDGKRVSQFKGDYVLQSKKVYQRLTSKGGEKIKKQKKKLTKNKRNFVSKHHIDSNKNATWEAKPNEDYPTKKDRVDIAGKYFLGSINSDFFPFDGSKRNYLKIREEDIDEEKRKLGIRYLKSKSPNLEGVSDKEIVFSSQPSDGRKPIEIFVTENIGGSYHPELPSSSAKPVLNSDIPAGATRSEDFIDHKLKEDQYSEDAETVQESVDHGEEPRYQDFKISNHNENLVDTIHKDEQQQHKGISDPFRDQQSHYYHLARGSDANDHNEHANRDHNDITTESENPSTYQHMGDGNRMHLKLDGEDYNHHEFKTKKLDEYRQQLNEHNFPFKIMEEDKSNKDSVVTDNSLVSSPSFETNQFGIKSRLKNDEEENSFSQNSIFHHEKDPAIDTQVTNDEEESHHGFPSAFTVTKAIMQSAKMIDRPVNSDDHVNFQNFMPEVYEAFSRTNNDLRQRYKMLRKWAAQRVAQHKMVSINEEELKEEVKNLNDLSSMVRLVNNLEKDMLKIILKRKRRLGERMGYKHENIPGSEHSKKRFNSPSDVQELLQYIYDTYIENRTADEIPVVLQAFQKSLADIVSKKNVSAKVALQDFSHGSSYLAESMQNKSNDEKESNKKFSTEEYEHLEEEEKKEEENRDTLHQLNSKGNSSTPLITVKLLKALDLFLDSIEIERKIKHFRAMVEDLASEINGSVVLTSEMRSSLGKINREINETLIQSELLNNSQNDTILPYGNSSTETVGNLLLSFPNNENLNLTKAKPSVFDEMNEILSPKDTVLVPKQMDNAVKLSNVKSYHVKLAENQEKKNREKEILKRNGLRDLDDQMNINDDLTYEKNWYGKNKFTNMQSRVNVSNLNLSHIYEPGLLDDGKVVSSEFEAALYNMIDTNISAVNKEAMKGLTYYATLVEKFQNETTFPSSNAAKFNRKLYSSENITNLNKEAMKGHEYYAKLADKLHKEIYNQTRNLTQELLTNLEYSHINISELNAEALKAQNYYNKSLNDSNVDQIYKLYLETQNMSHRNQEAVQSEWLEILNALNSPSISYPETDNFDTQVQKIIDKAISEAKNLSEAEQDYHKVQTSNISKSLDKAKDNLRNTLESHGVDQGAIKNVDSYLDAENKYIGHLFYGEGDHFNSENNFTFISREGVDQYQFFKQANKTNQSLEKKTTFPVANKEVGSFNIVEGQWDKRNMDSHVVKTKEQQPEDMLQIAHLKSLVQKLQEESLKEEERDDARFAKELILSKIPRKKKKKTNNVATHRVIIPKHNQGKDENLGSSSSSTILAHEISEIKRNHKSPDFANFAGRGLPVQVSGVKRDMTRYKSYSRAQAVLQYNKNAVINKRSFVREHKTRDGKRNFIITKRSQIPSEYLQSFHKIKPMRRHKKPKQKWRLSKHMHQAKNLKSFHRNKKDVILASKSKKQKSKAQSNSSEEEETPSLKDVIIKDSFFSRLSEAQQQLVWEAVKKDWKRQHNHATIQEQATSRLSKLSSREDISSGSSTMDRDKNVPHFSLRKKQLNKKHSSLNKESSIRSSQLPKENNHLSKSNSTEFNPLKKTDDVEDITNSFFNETTKIIDALPDSTDNATKRLCKNFLNPSNTPHDLKVVCNLASSKINQSTTQNAYNNMKSNKSLDEGPKKGLILTLNQTADANTENKTYIEILDSLKEVEKKIAGKNQNQSFLQIKSIFSKKSPADQLQDLIQSIKHINETVSNFNTEKNVDRIIAETGNAKYPSSLLEKDDSSNNTNEKGIKAVALETKLENNTNLVHSFPETEHTSSNLTSSNSTASSTDDIFDGINHHSSISITNFENDSKISNKSISEKKNFDFLIPSDQENVTQDLGETLSGGESDGKCKGDYIILRKGDFEYKIPAFKCNRNESKSMSVISWNKTERALEEMNKKSKCTPVYKSFVFGNSEFKLQVGCKENPFMSEEKKYSKFFSDNRSSELPSEEITKTNSRNSGMSKVKGKNVEMTQDIDYSLEEDTNDEILKQFGRLKKLPPKDNTTNHNSENFLTKSGVQPDYLKTSLNSTSTFKFKDTSITKNIYINGAKVITMKKEKDTLSIVYPPKNDTNNNGYMVLNENNATFKIPLYGNKDGTLSNNVTKSKLDIGEKFNDQLNIQNKSKAEFQSSSYKIEAPDSRGLKMRDLPSNLQYPFSRANGEGFDERLKIATVTRNPNTYGQQLEAQDGRRVGDNSLSLLANFDRSKPYLIVKPHGTPTADLSKQYEEIAHAYHGNPEKIFNYSPDPFKIQRYISTKARSPNIVHHQYLPSQSYHSQFHRLLKYPDSKSLGKTIHLIRNDPNFQVEFVPKFSAPIYGNEREPYNDFLNPVKDIVHQATFSTNTPYEAATFVKNEGQSNFNQAGKLPKVADVPNNYFEKPSSLLTYNNEQRVYPDNFMNAKIPYLYPQHQDFTNVLSKDFSPEYYAKDDENQMKILKNMQQAADAAINRAYMNVQKKLINKYTHLGSDRLDSFDEKQLEKLGYDPNDVNNINRQVLGTKRMMNSQELTRQLEKGIRQIATDRPKKQKKKKNNSSKN